jgi:uncharacterized membrane protein
MSSAILLAVGIGFVAGLRSMTAPAAVSWAAYLGRLDLQGTALSFMGSGIAVTILTTLALVEYAVDLFPTTPNRTKPGPLFWRIILGGLSGAAVTLSANQGPAVGVIAGGIGAVPLGNEWLRDLSVAVGAAKQSGDKNYRFPATQAGGSERLALGHLDVPDGDAIDPIRGERRGGEERQAKQEHRAGAEGQRRGGSSS